MTLLRLKQTALGNNRYRAELEFTAPNQAPASASAEFDFALTEQEGRDLRWYMEDYLQNPHEPAPQIAARIEARMSELGGKLFTDIFEANAPTTRLWAKFSDHLADLRIEISTTAQDATAIPWELLRDPTTDTVLALQAQAFVRAQPSERHIALPQIAHAEAIRILLVIARPDQGDDVPFRSVAARILKGLKGLNETDRKIYQLDVLRPATFASLGETLRRAKTAGKPYHVVHFDGHGTYGEATGGGVTLSATMYATAGKRGYLVFEGITQSDRLHDGQQIGKLLVETGVPVLLLNACQSAYAEPPDQPPTDAPADSHAEVRVFGSLAQQVMDAGVAGVVAMRYSVYVVTAAQFVAQLYSGLVSGISLGEAVTRGRKHLHDQPHRAVGAGTIPLQDWSVPLVYEAAAISLFPKLAGNSTVITISIAPVAQKAQDNLPRPPDVGFFGRDETLLALDRGYDTHSIALLHALAGSGKTTTAGEFARWYADTNGLGRQFALLFTSFERHKPLVRVLDDFAAAFSGVLDANNIPWTALELAQRRAIALQVLGQIPVLWLWDNVETVAGFPAGTASLWSDEEQRELIDFLRDARATKAKFLLTSRRSEDAWLGTLPFRVAMPPMPVRERIDLATALATRRGVTGFDAEAWRPLLRYTQGNPLTITVLVDQALKHGWRTRAQVEAFVAQLRAGEAQIEDGDADQGRGKSLAASLTYGFEAGFSEGDKAILALLVWFQGFVDADSLRVMGAPDQDWTLEAVRGKPKDALVALLNRAADAGLLTRVGTGLYTIHPALPWHFTRLFTTHYPDDAARLRAERAYVAAIAYWGSYYHNELGAGNPNVLGLLAAEEDNLLAARRRALQHGWHRNSLEAMQGLRQLYARTGRGAAWAALVAEVVPVFVEPTTDLPRTGIDEDDWGIVTSYRVRLALEERDLVTAARLQGAAVEVDRRRAAPALDGTLSVDAGRNLIRTLSVSIFTLGQIQREQGEGACVTAYEEALELDQRIGDRAAEAIAAFNLGHAYLEITTLRDLDTTARLDEAERWYQRSLDLRPPNEAQGRAQSTGQLGSVAYARFTAGRAAGVADSELLRHLNAAAQRYRDALALTPTTALPDLAVAHNQLGNIYDATGQNDLARQHYDAAIRYYEQSDGLYGAAGTRYNVAIMYRAQRDLDTALLYAESALRGFQSSPNAADRVQLAQQLIARIQRDKQGGTP